MFLILLVVGLVGLAMMAVPAIGRHGHGLGGGHGHALGGGHGHAALPAHGHASGPGGGGARIGTEATAGLTRFIPSPRVIFSFLALYGAFGNALERAGHLPTLIAALVALVPALLIERFAVTPLWNFLARAQGKPSAPLEELILSEARALTPFRNGKGLVSIVREGRVVQLAARLPEAQASRQVQVGDRLLVEDVDSSKERLTVSVPEE